MSRREFDGRPFVAGSLIGIRAFKIDGHGNLVGVVHEKLFGPGENHADCLLSPWFRQMSSVMYAYGINRPAWRHHQLAGLYCQCGYYAYFKGRNSYMGVGQVAGLVEGYGVCTIGSRGFRAEKARLVALVAPRRPRPFPQVPAWKAWLRLVGKVRIPLHAVVHKVAGIGHEDVAWRLRSGMRGVPAAQQWVDTHCEQVTIGIQAVLGFIIATGALYALDGPLEWAVWLTGMSLMWATPNRSKRTTIPPLSAAEFDVVRSRYPDVPVYRSRRAAVRAHPLTKPDKRKADA